MTVNIGGVEMGLNFKMGAREELERMLQERAKDTPFTESEHLTMIIEAGLICNNNIKGVEDMTDHYAVKKWVYEMDQSEAKAITDFFTQAYGLAGEGDKDTRGKAANVG